MYTDKAKVIKKIALTYPWPGVSVSGEAEVLCRIKCTLNELNIETYVIDNDGFILDEKFNKTERKLTSVDFVLATHFHSYKVLDSFYYFAIWNPPEIPLERIDYIEYMKHYLTNDDYLIYDEGSMKKHLESVLLNCPRNLEGASLLMASLPKSCVMEPNLDCPSLFYCGINWDLEEYGHGRNESVMKLLDNSGIIKIFGPEVNGHGVHPWKGYNCYQHSIPFDGFSLIEELNKCGICLVLSSDVHRRAGAVTNRVFEACAAGAVIISDNNPLVHEMFGDTILYVEYNKNNPKCTFEQIMEHYQWVVDHKQQALRLARESQKLFKERFSLDYYLINIIKNHSQRVKTVAKNLYALDDEKIILVTYICNTIKIDEALNNINKCINNIERQIYPNISLVVFLDSTIYEDVQNELKNELNSENNHLKLSPMVLFNNFNDRYVTDGEVLLPFCKCFNCSYIVNTNADEIWFSDHLTTLVRTIENEKTLVAVSGQLLEQEDGHRRIHLYDKFLKKALYKMASNNIINPGEMEFPYPGCFIFKKEVLDYIPTTIGSCLDGCEHLAILHLLVFKYNIKVSFSKRMTFVFPENYCDVKHSVLTRVMESNFIMGLSYFDREEKSSDSIGINELKKILLELPIKSYLLLRIIKVLLRFAHGSIIGEKITGLNNKLLNQYFKL